MAEQATILVVDDTPEDIDLMSAILCEEYRVKAATRGAKALEIACANPKPDLILLDIMMPEMDGYEVIEALKIDPNTTHIPVIFVTALSDELDEQTGLNMGAADYIIKPVSPALVRARVSAQLALYNQRRELERIVTERTKEIKDSRLEVIKRLGQAAEFKDNETGLHASRMSLYAKILAEAMIDDEEWVETLFHAAPMHDIGKIGVPDSLLLKREPLSEDEWTTMKKHALHGARIIGDEGSDLMRMASTIAEHHHERWDGSGYPHGKSGNEIPLAARIVAVADVFDVLTTERPYKEAWEIEDAIMMIEESAGSHFDPEVVKCFTERQADILAVMKDYEETAKPYQRSFEARCNPAN